MHEFYGLTYFMVQGPVLYSTVHCLWWVGFGCRNQSFIVRCTVSGGLVSVAGTSPLQYDALSLMGWFWLQGPVLYSTVHCLSGLVLVAGTSPLQYGALSLVGWFWLQGPVLYSTVHCLWWVGFGCRDQSFVVRCTVTDWIVLVVQGPVLCSTMHCRWWVGFGCRDQSFGIRCTVSDGLVLVAGISGLNRTVHCLWWVGLGLSCLTIVGDILKLVIRKQHQK